jgi:integrase
MVWLPGHLGRFLDAAEDDRLYGLFLVTAHCGLRRGEAAGLKRADTDLAGSAITISHQITQAGYKAVDGKPKDDSTGTVRLDDLSVAALRDERKRQLAERIAWGPAYQETGLTFTREDGSAYHPEYVSYRFERIAFDTGLPPVSFHGLRHGAAVLALAAGTDIKVISAMLRHSSVQITADIYADVTPELAAQTAAKVASMVPRKGRRNEAV